MAKKTIPETIERDIKEYINELKKDDLPITKVILFGSYAKGTSNRWSDIDLCIISPKFKDPVEAMQYLWLKKVKDTFPTIEPIGFNPRDFEDDTALSHEIKKTGIELHL